MSDWTLCARCRDEDPDLFFPSGSFRDAEEQLLTFSCRCPWGLTQVTERSVRRWRQAWLADGLPGLASKGQGTRCRLDDGQLAGLEITLKAGPLTAGYSGQRQARNLLTDLGMPARG